MSTTKTAYDFSVLRTLRKASSLTISELARRSGVSAPVISKLERNLVSPSLDTLFRIGKSLGLGAPELVPLAECRTAHLKEETSHESDGFTFREAQFGNAKVLLGSARGGGRTSQPHIHRDDYEICWVLEGLVRLSLPNETHELNHGQAVEFDATLEHTYEAIEDSRVLIIHLAKERRF